MKLQDALQLTNKTHMTWHMDTISVEYFYELWKSTQLWKNITMTTPVFYIQLTGCEYGTQRRHSHGVSAWWSSGNVIA